MIVIVQTVIRDTSSECTHTGVYTACIAVCLLIPYL
jgi:hypothetical protein